jgi:preprotein translocase subunit SecA
MTFVGFSFTVAQQNLGSTKFLKKEYRNVIEQYVNDTIDNNQSFVNIKDKINHFIREDSDSALFMICNIGNHSNDPCAFTIKYKEDKISENGMLIQQSRKECWISICCKKAGDQIDVTIGGYFDQRNDDLIRRYKNLREAFLSFGNISLKEQIQITLEASSIASALDHIKAGLFIDKKVFQGIDCNELLLEALLCRFGEVSEVEAYSKPALEDILYFIDLTLNHNSNYVLSVDALRSLSTTLGFEKYAPENGEDDLPFKVIKLFYDLKTKQRLQIDDEVQREWSSYFESIRATTHDHYTTRQLKESLQALITTPRDIKIINDFNLAVSQRAVFLKCCALLDPNHDSFSIKDLDEFFLALGRKSHKNTLNQSSSHSFEKSKSGQNDIIDQIILDSQNAYSQANNSSYWYRSEDITYIVEAIQDSYPDIKVNPPLGKDEGLQSLKRLIEEILKTIIVNDGNAHKAILIPLNVAGNHWISLAIVKNGNEVVALYKDSLGNDNHVVERGRIEGLFVELISSISEHNLSFRFIHNKHTEQGDGSSCGIFALANIEHMAQQIRLHSSLVDFIEQFELYSKFATQDSVDKLRSNLYPTKYLQGLCIDSRNKEIQKHHSPELEIIRQKINERLTTLGIAIDYEIYLESQRQEILDHDRRKFGSQNSVDESYGVEETEFDDNRPQKKRLWLSVGTPENFRNLGQNGEYKYTYCIAIEGGHLSHICRDGQTLIAQILEALDVLEPQIYSLSDSKKEIRILHSDCRIDNEDKLTLNELNNLLDNLVYDLKASLEFRQGSEVQSRVQDLDSFDYLIIKLADKLRSGGEDITQNVRIAEETKTRELQQTFNVSPLAIQEIIRIAKVSQNKRVKIAVIEIINTQDLNQTQNSLYIYEQSITTIVSDILPTISESASVEGATLIIEFAEKLKTYQNIQQLNTTAVISYLLEVLVKNPDQVLRQKALIVLQKLFSISPIITEDLLLGQSFIKSLTTEVKEDINGIFELEKIIEYIKYINQVKEDTFITRATNFIPSFFNSTTATTDSLSKFLNKCLDRVRAGKVLTYNCFKLLEEECLDKAEIIEIIRIILAKDVQGIPRSFIDNVKSKLKELSNQEEVKKFNIIELNKLLLKFSANISPEDIGLLVNQESGIIDDSLSGILYNAMLSGAKISDDIKTRIKSLISENSIVSKKFRAYMEKNDDIATLKNPRLGLEIRQKALQSLFKGYLGQNIKCSDSYIIKVLEDIIKYEDTLKDEVKVVLTHIIPDDYRSSHNIGISPLTVRSSALLPNTSGITDLPTETLKRALNQEASYHDRAQAFDELHDKGEEGVLDMNFLGSYYDLLPLSPSEQGVTDIDEVRDRIKGYVISNLLAGLANESDEKAFLALYNRFEKNIYQLSVRSELPLTNILIKLGKKGLDLRKICSTLELLQSESGDREIFLFLDNESTVGNSTEGITNADNWLNNLYRLWLNKAIEHNRIELINSEIESCINISSALLVLQDYLAINDTVNLELLLSKIDKTLPVAQLVALLRLLDRVSRFSADGEIALALMRCQYGISTRELESVFKNIPVTRTWITEELIPSNNLYHLYINNNLKILCQNGWGEQAILELLDNLKYVLNSKSEEDKRKIIKHFSNSISLLADYRIREYEDNINGENVLDILKTLNYEGWTSELNQLIVMNVFEGSHERKLNELIDELRKDNSDEHVQVSIDKLEEEYREVKNSAIYCDSQIQKYKQSLPLLHGLSEQEVTKQAIRAWAKSIKKPTEGTEHPTLYQKLAMVCKAVEVDSFAPRDIQLLSVLMMLNTNGSVGRLAQVNTGEGKTTIVAMLAAMHGLSGEKVDVITSSPELARPQSEEKESFFDIFGLTVSHTGKSGAYTKDIVYGAASDFQGDILRDEYSKLGTRSNRGFGVAIVDEVDSMLIDGKNHIVMLASPMPAMDHLEPVLASIYVQMTQVAQFIHEYNGNLYIVDPQNKDQDGNIDPELLTQLKPIGSRQNGENLDDIKEHYIKEKTELHLRKLLRDQEQHENSYLTSGQLSEDDKRDLDRYPVMEIPLHLREFVLRTQLVKWIDSAITARYKLKAKEHYIVENNKILPVDAENTGIVQTNMNWSDGVHQFLQLKHGAKITAETITTNFISNVAFFKRYIKTHTNSEGNVSKTNRIYGLTGTLGNKDTRDLLSEVYEVDCVTIPPFKNKQYNKLRPIITGNNKLWQEKVVQQAKLQLDLGRGVLIIAQHIKDVESIEKGFELIGYPKEKIKIYKTEKDSASVKDFLRSGEVIIATNIAGRGTDIKPSTAVEQNGGLHVCVTFLPQNERIEIQNFGRTSRTGNRGTGQLILNREELQRTYPNLKVWTIESLEHERTRLETTSLESARVEIKDVENKDRIFKEFCKLLDNLTDTERDAVEERFALWLKINEQEISRQSTDEACITFFENNFKTQIDLDMLSGRVIQNPYYYLLKANKLLEDKQYEKALEIYNYLVNEEHASRLGTEFVPEIYYHRGYTIIKLYGNAKKAVYDEWIPKAIESFARAKKIIEEKIMPMLDFVQLAAESKEVTGEQIKNKKAIYGVMLSAIEQAIGQGDDAKLDNRLEAVKKHIDKITSLQKNAQDTYHEVDGVKEAPIEVKTELLKRHKLIDDDTVLDIEILNKYFDEYLTHTKEEKDKYLSQLEQLNKNKSEIEKEVIDCRSDEQKRSMQEITEIGVIGVAKRKDYGIEIEMLTIENGLGETANIDIYRDEISERRTNGLLGPFKVSEIKPIDWWSVIGVMAIGLVQMIGGAAMAVFSLGAATQFALGFIAEGVSDLITAVMDGIINRDFSWAAWGMQKAISLTISIACAGLAALKEAAGLAKHGVKVAMGATKAAIGFTKEGMKLGAKLMGKALAKGVAKEVINNLVRIGINKALLPMLEQGIKNLVEGKITNILTANQKLEELLAEDAANRDNFMYQKVLRSLLSILEPTNSDNSSTVLSSIKTFSIGVAKGIGQDKVGKALGDSKIGISEIMLILNSAKTAAEVAILMTALESEVNSKIDDIYEKFKEEEKKNLATIKKLSTKYQSVTDEKERLDRITIDSKLERSKVERYVTQLAIQTADNGSKLTTSSAQATATDSANRQHQAKVADSLTAEISAGAPTIHAANINLSAEEGEQCKHAPIRPRNNNDISTEFSKSVSGKITAIINGGIIMPLASYGVNKATDKAFSTWDKSLEDELGQFQNKRRQLARTEAPERADAQDEYQRRQDAKAAAKAARKNKGAAEDRTSETDDQMASRIVADLDNSGEAGLHHLGPIAKDLERPIAICDKDGNVVSIIGKQYGGEPVKVQHMANDIEGSGGHWVGLDASGKAIGGHSSSGQNNCLFDAIAAQTGKDPNELRQATIKQLKDNPELMRAQARDVAQCKHYMGGVLKLAEKMTEKDKEILLENLQKIDPKVKIGDNSTIITGTEDGLISELASNSDEVTLSVEHGEVGSNYDLTTKKVMLNPNKQTLCTVEGGQDELSTIDTTLYHELGHGYRHITGLLKEEHKKFVAVEVDLGNGQTRKSYMPAEEAVNVGILFESGSKYSENEYRESKGYKKRVDYHNSRNFSYDQGEINYAHTRYHEKQDHVFRAGDTLRKSEPDNSPVVIPNYTPSESGFNVFDMSDIGSDEEQQGLSHSNLATMEGIHASFYEYKMQRISNILRLRTITNRLNNLIIFPNIYMFSAKYNNITTLVYDFYLSTGNASYMNRSDPIVFLTPISLHGKHAVGVMFVAQGDGSGYKAFYLDPENTTIPEGLAAIFKDNGYQIEQLPTEGQRYTNCGPEVIENFMLYLTGERLSQEDAIVNNSRLIEQELLSSSHDAEEAICLTLKDSYSKEKAVTVISNTTDNTQVTSDGYIIGNPTRYDIVTPQTIIDGLIVRADLGREPHDVLLQLVHDYRINQDYAEAILGEVTSIDIS